MISKLIKIYVVVAKKEIKRPERPKSFFDRLFDTLLGGPIKEKKEYSEYNMAVFSTKKLAEKYISNDVLPFDFHSSDCRIEDWKVDYEILWKEWNKKEEK